MLTRYAITLGLSLSLCGSLIERPRQFHLKSTTNDTKKCERVYIHAAFLCG